MAGVEQPQNLQAAEEFGHLGGAEIGDLGGEPGPQRVDVGLAVGGLAHPVLAFSEGELTAVAGVDDPDLALAGHRIVVDQPQIPPQPWQPMRGQTLAGRMAGLRHVASRARADRTGISTI